MKQWHTYCSCHTQHAYILCLNWIPKYVYIYIIIYVYYIKNALIVKLEKVIGENKKMIKIKNYNLGFFELFNMYR